MSPGLAKFVPWSSFDEWLEVRECFFGNRNATQRDWPQIRLGILMVRMWMERGKVPISVEATVNFFQVLLQDFEHREPEPDADEEDDDDGGDRSAAVLDRSTLNRCLQHAYNSAVIRFVNELVEQGQKGLYANSVWKIADQFNLPRFFVDLRHDGTHDSMPTLDTLRWAAEQALLWLQERYWDVEADGYGAWFPTTLPKRIYSLLHDYLRDASKVPELSGSMQAMVRSSTSRLINGVDALCSNLAVMRIFLNIVMGPQARLPDPVQESIVRAAAREAPRVFYVALARMPTVPAGWWIWAVEEMPHAPFEAVNECFSILMQKAVNSHGAFMAMKQSLWPLLSTHESVPVAVLVKWSATVDALGAAWGSNPTGTAACPSTFASCVMRSKRLLDVTEVDLDDWH